MSDLKQEEIEITYGIRRIKDIYFQVNEFLLDKENPSKKLKIELNQNFSVNNEHNLVNCTIGIYFHYQDTPQNIILAEIKVENVYFVNSLKDITNKNERGDYLPPQLIVSLLGLSISHSRALFSKNLAGTAFQNVFLPISNPLHIAKHFFPEEFKDFEIVKPD